MERERRQECEAATAWWPAEPRRSLATARWTARWKARVRVRTQRGEVSARGWRVVRRQAQLQALAQVAVSARAANIEHLLACFCIPKE